MRVRVRTALRSLKDQPSGHAQTRDERPAGAELYYHVLAAAPDFNDRFARERTPKVDARRSDCHLAKTDAHVCNAPPNDQSTQSAGDRFDFR